MDIPVDLDQCVLECAVLVGNQHTSSNTKISIKPSVPDASTIQLDTNFEVARLLLLGNRFDLRYRET
jgi:hypothetical protein